MLLVAAAVQHSVLDQGVEPCLEDVAGDAEVVMDRLEAVPAEADVPQHQQCPPLADDLQGPGQRAGKCGEVGLVHCTMLLTTDTVTSRPRRSAL